jgi:fibronectin-binding autotransporter adhesin
VAAGVTNDSISGLSASTLYYFRVRASNAGGNSAYSNTNHATTLAPPAGLVWKGDGAANVWDVGVTANWLSGGVAAQFVNGVATTFDDTGSNTPAINLTTNVSPASLTVSASQNYIFGGAGLITGGASLTKSGTGSLTFTNTGNNTFSGGVTISNGIVALGTDSPSPTTENQFALGTGLVTVSTNGQLRFGGKSGGVSNFFITNAVTINGGTLFAADGRQHLSNAVVNVQPAGGTLLTRWKTKDIVIDSVLTGGGPLTVNYGLYVDGVAGDGGGSVYLSSPLNTYSGTLTVLTNTIVLTSPYALSNATLNAQGTGTSSNLVWSGISSITLGGLSGAGNIPLGANQLVVCNNNSSTAYSGVLSGTGSLVTMGGGVFTLSGANTYSGTTTVSGGKLVVNNTAGSGTGFGAVTVGSGGTLGGNGIISGATTVNAGGTLSPGNSPGTLTFSNALTLNSGCTNYFEINKSPVTNDVARVLGALTCGGTLIVTNLGTNALAANDSFKLFNAASYGGAFANVTLPPLAAGLNWNTNALNTNGTLAVVVSVLSTATVLNPLSAVTYGTPVTFTATVSPTPTTGDTVTFKDGVVTMGTGTTSVSGVATFTTTNTQLSAATHSITAVFAGDASFATSTSGASNQVVNQKSLTPVITLNSRPYDGTTSAATIAIRLLTGVVGNDDVNLGTSGVVAAFGSKNAGSSTINITGLSLSGTKAANYLLVSTATTATGTITQTNSITAVSSSANPSYMNDNVKFVATVTGLDTPTGAVQFLTNGLFFDSEALAAGLATSAATTLLPSGTNTVTAAYSGDVNYLASTNSLSQVVVGQPQFNTISVGANGLVMGGSGGIANGTYYVLGTSNMTAPLGLWPPLLTNQFDAVGNFNFTNPMDTNSPQGFYLLQLP